MIHLQTLSPVWGSQEQHTLLALGVRCSEVVRGEQEPFWALVLTRGRAQVFQWPCCRGAQGLHPAAEQPVTAAYYSTHVIDSVDNRSLMSTCSVTLRRPSNQTNEITHTSKFESFRSNPRHTGAVAAAGLLLNYKHHIPLYIIMYNKMHSWINMNSQLVNNTCNHFIFCMPFCVWQT